MTALEKILRAKEVQPEFFSALKKEAMLAFDAYFVRHEMHPSAAEEAAFRRVVKWLSYQNINSNLDVTYLRHMFELIMAA